MKSANARFWNSVTTHGRVVGRRTVGAAVAGFEEPTCGVGPTTTTCAPAVASTNSASTTAPITFLLGTKEC